jgi:hypothetical protein
MAACTGCGQIMSVDEIETHQCTEASPLMEDMVDALRRLQPAIIVLRDILYNAGLMDGTGTANYWISATGDLVERYESGER